MALQTFSVRRLQDPVLATAVHSEITPLNWHKFPPAVPVGGVPPVYVPTVTYQGGARGDDVSVATINTTSGLAPLTQTSRAALTAPAGAFARDITQPRGWIEPDDPYRAPPVSPTDDPTITSLAPNTGVSGAGKAPTWVTITGTKFTQWSTVVTGGVTTPYFRYVSPTRIDMLQDPRSSAGTVTVQVRDHGVLSNSSNFTFT